MIHYAVTEVETDEGVDLTIECEGVALTEQTDKGTVVVRLRNGDGPRIGERIMCHGRLIKVADKRYDDDAKLWVMDEDTLAWYEL